MEHTYLREGGLSKSDGHSDDWNEVSLASLCLRLLLVLQDSGTSILGLRGSGNERDNLCELASERGNIVVDCEEDRVLEFLGDSGPIPKSMSRSTNT